MPREASQEAVRRFVPRLLDGQKAVDADSREAEDLQALFDPHVIGRQNAVDPILLVQHCERVRCPSQKHGHTVDRQRLLRHPVQQLRRVYPGRYDDRRRVVVFHPLVENRHEAVMLDFLCDSERSLEGIAKLPESHAEHHLDGDVAPLHLAAIHDRIVAAALRPANGETVDLRQHIRHTAQGFGTALPPELAYVSGDDLADGLDCTLVFAGRVFPQRSETRRWRSRMLEALQVRNRIPGALADDNGHDAQATPRLLQDSRQFLRADVVGIQEIDGEQEQGATRGMQRVVQRVFPAFSRAYLGVDPDRRLGAQAHGQMLAKILRHLDVLVRVADEDPVPDITDVHS